MWILNILALNLIIVFITELPLAFLLGAKSLKKIITSALVNIITNPAVVLFSLSLTLIYPDFQSIGLFISELLAFFTEGFMFSKFKTFGAKNPYVISLLLNLASFTAGEIIEIFL